MAEYQKVLVGIDGSPQSAMALKKGIAAAKRNHAQLYLLSVVNEPSSKQKPSYGFIDQAAYEKTGSAISKLLEHQKQQALAAGVSRVETKVIDGNAKLELSTGFVSAEGIDLVVLGASGLNMVGRLIVGSTTAYVVRQAPCDVMIVRTDEDNHQLKIDKSSYPTM